MINNLKDEKIENCTFTIKESPLNGEYQVETILGETLFESIRFGEGGKLEEWSIGRDIEAAEVFIIRLK